MRNALSDFVRRFFPPSDIMKDNFSVRTSTLKPFFRRG